jgi:mannose/cellobiose epimerase-like protein (N-acyl-D-glucosamine 2-epimerase family)
MNTLNGMSDRIRSWLFDHAWPFWMDAGIDRQHGGFVEYLDLQGRDGGASYKRVRAQARQIYCISQAALCGASGAAELSDRCWSFFLKARRADGGWASRLSRDGDIIDPASDAYDIAFVLFAHAWRYRLTGDPSLIASAYAAIDGLDRDLGDGERTGWFSRADEKVPRQQNPHMHLLEAALELAMATNQSRFFEMAANIVSLMTTRMFDPVLGVLREFFGHRWEIADDQQSHIVEPGHHYEWVWLLRRSDRLLNASTDMIAERLYAFAERYGVDRESRLVFDEVDVEGMPRRISSRSWPQAEALKAHLSMFERGRLEDASSAVASASNLFYHYLSHPIKGAWIDHIDKNGKSLIDKIPSTTLYHLQLAFTEFLRMQPSIPINRPMAAV